MEGLPWIPEPEHLLGNKDKDLLDGSVEIFTSESSNAKRKVESLFCVMKKRTCRDNSADDDEIDFRFENLNDPLDMGLIKDGCSGSDTDLSESSEFDVIISEHVLQDNDLITGSKSLSICNFPVPNEDEGTLVSKWPLETQNSILLLSPNERNGAKSKEDSSGACGSLGEELSVNVSSSEDRDAELAQTPSTLYQEEVDGEDEICFSDVDAMIRKLNLVPDDSDSCLNREEWNMSKHPRHALLGLEHCTRTSVMFQGAIAVLHCHDSKHFVRKHNVIIGRSSDGLNVDIDLGKYGYGSKISRRQALVKLEKSGSFSLKNLGKRHILVNGEKLDTGQIVTLTSCSSIDIRGIIFVFKINKEAVRQFLKNNTGRKSEDDTKFRWCE